MAFMVFVRRQRCPAPAEQRRGMGAQVRCQWGVSPAQESALTAVVFAGTMAGAYSWGALGDARGRRAGFFATAVFTFAFGAASGTAPSFPVRFFLGFIKKTP